MPKNPFTDVWQFLTGTTGDYLHQGNWRYLILALFWILLLASIAIAFRNWQEDRLGFQGWCSAMARGKGGGREREGCRKQFGKLCGKGIRRLAEARDTFFAGFHNGRKLLAGRGAH